MDSSYILIPYRELNHGSFNEEWPPHKKVSGWWYVTGYFYDKQEPNHLYTYQYTVIQGLVLGKMTYILHIAFSDMKEGTHLFKQKLRLRRGKKVKANHDSVVYEPFTILKKEEDDFELEVSLDEFDLNLVMQKGKGAVWHCDNGVLVMGTPNDPKQRTVYYSYTNMPTEGTLTIRDKSGKARKIEVVGKSWFDRQYGPFRLLDRYSHWEWFSFRFFDDEEIMLFYFPQHPYQDGTYIDEQARPIRVQDYEIKPKDFVKAGDNDYTFSFGWEITIPGIKEEKYTLEPLSKGQFNSGYFELMAKVLNPKNEHVGYCFVELLAGARNELSLFKQFKDFKKKKSTS